MIVKRKVGRYLSGNQRPYIKEERTMKWSDKKEQTEN
jgi:hypothetical protein